MDGYPVSVLGGASSNQNFGLPLANNSVIFHAVDLCKLREEERYLITREMTHLLILSIRSIFLMPSQWRISGMRAWKRMSLTPATFSVRLK